MAAKQRQKFNRSSECYFVFELPNGKCKVLPAEYHAEWHSDLRTITKSLLKKDGEIQQLVGSSHSLVLHVFSCSIGQHKSINTDVLDVVEANLRNLILGAPSLQTKSQSLPEEPSDLLEGTGKSNQASGQLGATCLFFDSSHLADAYCSKQLTKTSPKEDPDQQKRFQALTALFPDLPEGNVNRAHVSRDILAAFREILATYLQTLINQRMQSADLSDYEKKSAFAKTLNEYLRGNGLALCCKVADKQVPTAVRQYPAFLVAVYDDSRDEPGRFRFVYQDDSGKQQRVSILDDHISLELMAAPVPTIELLSGSTGKWGQRETSRKQPAKRTR